MGFLNVDQAAFSDRFNLVPQALSHGLHEHPLFAPDNVRALVAGWPGKDFFVAGGAPDPGTAFYAAPHTSLTPAAAFEVLGHGSHRILLKRLEQHSPGFRELLASLLEEVLMLHPVLRREKIVRLESFMFISSASTITPFHFDPEIGFFFQILGNKTYHIYSPDVLAEQELEKYYLAGQIDIGQVDLGSRKALPEFRFDLAPGLGMHQPANAPHWVETSDTLSISYSFSIETDRTRSVGRTRAFNGLCRRLSMTPASLGAQPMADSMKANCMQLARPLISGSLAVARMIR